MDVEDVKNTIDELGFIGFDSYECKAKKGEYWLYSFVDNEFMKDGHPNGFVIHREGKLVFEGMVPDSKEELLVLLKLVGVL